MKKIILVFICVFTVQMLSAQFDYCEIKLHSGEELKGVGKFRGDFYKYKLYKKAKGKKISYTDIDYIKVAHSRNNIKTYRYFKIAGKDKGKVFEEIIVGKVCLYVDVTSGFDGINGMSMMAMDVVDYYVKRPNDSAVTHITTTGAFSSADFKKVATTFFADCTKLIEKIHNRKFKSRHIKDVVKFYNEKCN